MSRNISISDDIYERLAREKGDRSFSELIADLIEPRRTLAEVSGVGVLDPGTYEDVKADIAALSEGTARRFAADDEAA